MRGLWLLEQVGLMTFLKRTEETSAPALTRKNPALAWERVHVGVEVVERRGPEPGGVRQAWCGERQRCCEEGPDPERDVGGSGLEQRGGQSGGNSMALDCFQF